LNHDAIKLTSLSVTGVLHDLAGVEEPFYVAGSFIFASAVARCPVEWTNFEHLIGSQSAR